MEEKNLIVVLNTLAERISILEGELKWANFKCGELTKEKDQLTAEKECLRNKITTLAEQIACLECGLIQEAEDGKL